MDNLGLLVFITFMVTIVVAFIWFVFFSKAGKEARTKYLFQTFVSMPKDVAPVAVNMFGLDKKLPSSADSAPAPEQAPEPEASPSRHRSAT